MAIVYRAQDETLRREVAVKVLHPHLCAETDSKLRLQREAQAVAKLRHDNILQIFDYSGGESLASYIVTEFIDGLTLRQWLAAHKLPIPEVASLIVLELARAVAHAHSLGIIHRDIKPDNVMVRKDGVLKLMDFGVAQVLDLERMTVTGQLLGSPAYMAPEIFEGKPLDVRTDVFSLGVLLYQMATGELPFSGRNPHEVLKRITEGRFKDPRGVNRLVSDRLSRIIARALARRPDDRYPTVVALNQDLEAYLTDAGLGNVREELRGYFTAPDEYGRLLSGRVVAALVTAGRREQMAKRLARALEAWNRALALDPNNAAVGRELTRLEGRRRLRHGAVILGGTALLGGLIWGAFKIAREEVPAPVAKAMVKVPRVAPAVKPEPTPPALVTDSVPATTRTKVKRRGLAQERKPADDGSVAVAAPPVVAQPARLPRTAAGVMQKKRFTIGPNPSNVTIKVDDLSPFSYGIDRDFVELASDRPHTIVFSNETCCFPLEIEVDPNKPNPQVDFTARHIVARLPRKVANLTVRLKPPNKDARLAIKEITDDPNPWQMADARPEEQITIPFDARSQLQKTLEVSVYLGDVIVRSVKVPISAGQRKAEFPIKLD